MNNLLLCRKHTIIVSLFFLLCPQKVICILKTRKSDSITFLATLNSCVSTGHAPTTGPLLQLFPLECHFPSLFFQLTLSVHLDLWSSVRSLSRSSLVNISSSPLLYFFLQHLLLPLLLQKCICIHLFILFSNIRM